MRRCGGDSLAARLILAVVLTFAAMPSHAAPDPESEKSEAGTPRRTGLPLPRFASLSSGKVNLRRGPDKIYPIDWVLLRKGMPVEIVDEYELWRKIRDADGSTGWVHKSMLAGQRTAIVTGQIRDLHIKPDPASDVIAQVEPGVIGKILNCRSEWCRIDVGSARGWIRRDEIWGVYDKEELD